MRLIDADALAREFEERCLEGAALIRSAPTIGTALIERNAAYKALMHEAETHMLPEYKEAYKRAAGIIAQMRSYSDDAHGQCVYRGQEECLRYIHENEPTNPDDAAAEFLKYLLGSIPAGALAAYAAGRLRKEEEGGKQE